MSRNRIWIEKLWRAARPISFVRQLLKPGTKPRKVGRPYGWAIEPLDARIVPTALEIPIQVAGDQIYDPHRDILWIPDHGVLQRFNMQTQTLLTPWSVGVDLGAADITPDGKYLYIVELLPVGADAVIRKVDLDTADVTTLVVDAGSGGAGVFDVEVAADGLAFLTMSDFSGPRSFPVYQLDLATDTISVRPDAPGSLGGGLVTQNSFMQRGSDHRIISFVDQFSPNGRIFLYDSVSHTFSKQADTGTFFPLQPNVSRDNTLISLSAAGSPVRIYNSNLQLVTTLTGVGADGANAFDAERDIFYAINSVTNEILALDTHSWTTLFKIPFGQDVSANPILHALDDGVHIIFSSGDSGPVFEFTLPALVGVQTAEGGSSSVSTVGASAMNGDNGAITAFEDAEGNSATKPATVTVTLAAPVTQTVTLNYTTVDGTAKAGSDYTATAGTLTFQPGQTSQTITIPIIGDTVVESDEDFGVILSNPVNAVLFQSLAKVTIRTDDSGTAPNLAGLNSTITFLENDVNSTAQVIDNNVVFTDLDTLSFNGGNLTLAITSGGGVEDHFEIQNQGTGAGQIGVSGTTITYGGGPIATFSTVSGLTVTFISNAASPAAIQALARNLTYRNTSDTPAASRVISIVVTDGFGKSSLPATSTLKVTAQNDPPAVSNILSVTISQDTSVTVPFTVGDDQTSVDNLSITAVSSNTVLLPDSAVVLGGSGANRTVSLSPLLSKTGLSTITVKVGDGAAFTTRTFQLIVNPVNTAPTMTQIDDQFTNEDVATSPLSFTVGDLDSPVNSLIVTAASSNSALVPQSGIVFSGTGASRTVQITPAADFNGTTTITLTVSDGSATSTRSFNLTVNPVPDLPTLSHIANRPTNEDTSTGPLAFTVADADIPVSELTVTVSSSDPTLVPASNLILGGSGNARTLTVIPATNVSGTVLITLTVSDGTTTVVDSFSLTIVPVNDAPTISHINANTTDEDTTTPPIGFTIGDVDTAIGLLTVTVKSSNPALVPNSNLVLSGSGANRAFTATPVKDVSGTANITISVSDGTTVSETVMLLTVFPVDDAATIVGLQNQVVDEDHATPVLNFTIADVDTPNNSLVITAVSSNPALIPNQNLVLGGTGGNRTLQATPLANQSGNTVITVSVDDGLLVTSQTFTITVNAVNDLPTITTPPAQTIEEDTATAALAFTVGDVESAASGLTVTASSSDQALVPDANLILTGSGANRQITVMPVTGQSGTVTITLTVSDGTSSTSTSFPVTVLEVNNFPSISGIADLVTDEDVSIPAIPFTLSDLDTPLDSLMLTASSSNLLLVPNSRITFSGSGAARTVLLSPAANQSGTTLITISASDGTTTTSKTFLLTVNAVNDPPTVTDLFNLTIPENTSTQPLLFAVNDVETNSGSLSVSGQSSNPGLVPNANIVFGGVGSQRSAVITPLANQSGTATITISVSDGNKTTETTFVLTVDAVNLPPFASAISSQTIQEDGSLSVSFTVGDVETAAENLTVTASSSDATLISNANLVMGGTGSNRTLTATPLANQSGLTVITLSISDGTSTTTKQFSIVVTSVNDAPTFTLGADQIVNEDAAPVVVPGWVTEISAGATNESDQTLVFSVTTDHPELFSIQPAITPGGQLSYTVAPNASGHAIATVRLRDKGGTTNGGSDTSTATTFEITVTPVDDPLAFSTPDPMRQFAKNRPLVIDPQLAAHDVDTPNLDFSNGHLTISIASGVLQKDALSLPIAKKKSPAGGIKVVGTAISYQNRQIGTLQGGTASSPLQIQFGSGVSESDVNALLKALTFTTKGKQPPQSARTIRLELHDAANVEHAETTRVIELQSKKSRK